MINEAWARPLPWREYVEKQCREQQALEQYRKDGDFEAYLKAITWRD